MRSRQVAGDRFQRKLWPDRFEYATYSEACDIVARQRRLLLTAARHCRCIIIRFESTIILARILKGTVDIRDGEARACLWSAGYFFCVLCGYFVLRPIRESMGLESGVDTLHWLFLATLGVTVIVNPIFSALVSRVRRGVFIPVTYHFFVLNLVLFYLFRVFFADHVGIAAGRVFYVWLSVFNLFAVSVFWGFMSDGFTLEQGKRLYGFIGVGGTLGAIAGSAFTKSFAEPMGTPNLMLVSIVLLEAAVLCVVMLNRTFKASLFRKKDSAPSSDTCWNCGYTLDKLPTTTCPECGKRPEDFHSPDQPLQAGGAFLGFRSIATSPYLSGIGSYMLMMSVLATFMYFLQARIVEAAADSLDERTAIFATIDFWAQVLTLLTQLFLTGRLIRVLGVGGTLTILPAMVAAGFLAVAIAPSLIVLSSVQAITRAARYAVTTPARETLFTVVSREEKYKAKSLIDTFFPRFGDVVGALGDGLLTKFAVGVAGVTVIAAPLAIVWAGIGLALGLKQSRLAKSSGQLPLDEDDRS